MTRFKFCSVFVICGIHVLTEFYVLSFRFVFCVTSFDRNVLTFKGCYGDMPEYEAGQETVFVAFTIFLCYAERNTGTFFGKVQKPICDIVFCVGNFCVFYL